MINERANCTAEKAANGAFVYQPADPNRPISQPTVLVNGSDLDPTPAVLPITGDCPEQSNPVISSEELNNRPDGELPPAPSDEPLCGDPSSPACLKIRRKLLLEKEFRCHSTLGTGGCTIEKGLEAMRLALSCGGPNAELFKECCEDYNENDPIVYKQMTDKKIAIELSAKAKEQLQEEGFDAKMGARPLQRVISTRIKLPLGKKILFDTISDQKLTVDYDKDSDEFNIN